MDGNRINELLNQQDERIEQLRKFITNYGKANKTVKSKREYYESSLEKLDKWWKEFDETNDLFLEPTGDEYFENETYEDTKKKYEEIKKKLQEELAALVNIASTSRSSKQRPSMVNLLDDDVEQRNEDQSNGINHNEEGTPVVRVLKFQLRELRGTFESLRESTPTSQGLANAQLENLKLIWAEFRSTFRTVLTSQDGACCDGINFNELQKEYIQLCGKLNDVANIETKKTIQLPKIKIPEFNGNKAEWRDFKDLFDKIVHNNPTINESIKVQYLKTSLTGEAATIVSHLLPNGNNYKACYEILNNRYNNTRELVSDLIDKILELPKQNDETSAALRNMYDTTNECITAINNLKVPVENWDPIIIHLLKKKLSKSTVLDYESKLNDVRELQSLKSFMKYIENRFMALLSFESSVNKKALEVKNFKKDKSDEVAFQCSYCEKKHSVYGCKEFENLEVKNRVKWAKEKRACYLCLQFHKFGECKSKFLCRKCNKNHNTLLHLETVKNKTTLISTSLEESAVPVNTENEQNLSALIVTRDENNLLATAIVKCIKSNGEKIQLRAVIDPGSQSSIITEEAMQLLGLKYEKISAGIDGLSATENKVTKRVEINVMPRFNDNYVLETRALIMKKITNLKVFKGDLKEYGHLQNLLYADPTTNNGKTIDILLGVGDWARIIKNGLIKGAENTPIAQNTEFGWVIMGPDKEKARSISITSLISITEVEEKLNRFFEAEKSIIEDDDEETFYTDEEKYCEEYFKETTKRAEDGKFVVSMPYKNKLHPVLGDSKRMALATLFQLEKRFEKNENLRKQYTEAIMDAIKNNHMKLIEFPKENAHYIPHHAVIKESTTTKLRTVYNASQKTSNGLSLNEQLAIGKIVQPTILNLMMQWRMYKIAIIGDLEKMYKQIWLNEDQRHLQTILWRNSVNERIKNYELTTVTFGLSPSPFLAIRILKEISNRAVNKYPLAAKAIKECFYVDDYTGGAETVKEAIEMYDQLKNVFKEYGFNIRKFMSNSVTFLEQIPAQDKEEYASSVTKTLGVAWEPATDVITFKINFDVNKRPKTKRQLLSEIATLYDPIGCLAPMIVKAKILMQDVWQLKKNDDKKYNWDDKLPKNIINEWMKFKTHAIEVNKIKIPRWLSTTANIKIQLHGFCDASMKAISACVYVRCVNQNDQITTTLLIAKTKNASKIQQTIPKLELCAATLLTQIVLNIKNSGKMEIEKIFLWSDAKVVLAWIEANPQRYKKYVASRIATIQKLKDVVWCHIPGDANPADCASRGIFGNELRDNKLWWNGPEMLREDVNYESFSGKNLVTNKEEMSCTLITTKNESNELPAISSWYKMRRVFVYIIRFINYTRKRKLYKGPITTNEIEEATTQIIQIAQLAQFESEIKTLKAGKELKMSCSIIGLNVFLDQNNVLRVGGRLKNNNMTFNTLYPVIIPKQSSIAQLIIRETHEKNFHAGQKLTEAIKRKKYWIINGPSMIRNQLRKCVKCRKFNPKPMIQMMGELPISRTTIVSKPFTNTMVDFTGAVFVKTSKMRNAKVMKAYICIFACMSTKAVHIELVSDLSAEAFIAALRRFVARRGEIKTLNSDNGTNFVGSNTILLELTALESEYLEGEVQNELTNQNIQWKFSPPAAPHFNGLIEAGVKSAKTLLLKAVGEVKLTFEEMTTVLAQIEAMLNSRPLVYLSSDPNDTMLTPAHFTLNAPPTAVADENFDDNKMSYLNRWKLVQKITQQFWKQWSEQYLSQIQSRSKWFKKKGINEGDVVLIKEENLPPCKWLMGKVIQKYDGDDGLTRVVTLQTKTGLKNK